MGYDEFTMLPILLDRSLDIPLAVQLATRLRGLISQGVIRANEPVPSTRAMCIQLGVSRGTVVAAYDQLIAESYLVSLPGGKTRVHPSVRTVPNSENSTDAAGLKHTPRASRKSDSRGRQQHRTGVDRALSEGMNAGPHPHGSTQPETAAPNLVPVPVVDLAPRASRTERIDDSTWREAWRSAAAAPPLGSEDKRAAAVQGLPQLRQAISEHLRLMRSMDVDPENIFVTTGARDGLFLTILALNSMDVEVAVESPGYPGLRRALKRAGARVAEVDVDDAGIKCDEIPTTSSAVLVTPNHLYPIGGVIPAPRRLELLAWAGEHNVLLIEDDLDSESRHVGPVLPTLWELAPEQVVHLGTFNQVLSAEVRIGYLIVPRNLHEPMHHVLNDLGASASTIAQRALATYLSHGGLRRQIAKSRREVVRRRATVELVLDGYVPQINASAHAVVEMSSHEHAALAKQRCEQRGVLVGELTEYWGTSATSRSELPLSGLVVSYADVPVALLESSLRVIREVCDEIELPAR